MSLFTPHLEPPHCPRRRCRYHLDPTGWQYRKDGFHERKHAPFKVQRYLCLACHRSFSDQTFRLGYWCRRQDLFGPVFQAVMACSGLRQACRQLGLTRVTVACRIERLGRHCLLLHHALRPRELPPEPVVLDGFESFEYSQYAPMHLNLLVGSRSCVVHGFTESELRRKGRMTSHQKRTRERLESRFGRPDPKAIQKRVTELLRIFIPQRTAVELRSDEHPAYARSLRELQATHDISHQVTPSKVRRTPDNPLFAVNLTDLLLRHGSSNHKRETIAFSKRRQAIVERGWMFVVWRNLLKSRSEQRQDDPPAVALRWVPSRPTCEQLLARRLFPTHIVLPEPLQHHYWRRIFTRYLPHNRTHDLIYAF